MSSTASLLVVDDQPVNIRTMHELFSGEYRVLMSTSGAEALSIAASQRPDLILLDVEMPEMDGYQVCRQLKLHPDTAHIPVIFVTSHGDAEAEVRGLEAGAVDFITKPIQPSIVRSRVRTHVTLKQSREAMAVALREKETLLKEVYHRVKNNLQVVSSLLSLQQRSLTDALAREALGESIDRVAAMSIVHEKLYQSTNLSTIVLSEYIDELCTHLRVGAGAASRQVEIEYQVEPIAVGMELAVPLGMLVSEIITNSLKHAFTGRASGRIDVAIRVEAGHGVLDVSDNGIGLDPAVGVNPSDPDGRRTSLGMKLIRALSRQIDGNVVHSSSPEGGTRVMVTFALGGAGTPTSAQ